MSNSEYEIQAKEVAEIIDIGIVSFKNHPPEDFSPVHIEMFVNTYLDLKNKALNPEPKFANLKSLKQIKNDALVFFQEGSGKTVEYFWKTIAEKNIPLKRDVNKLDKLLKRGKIRDQMEYDWIIDTFNSHSLTKDEATKIDSMITKFESRK